MTNPVDIKKCLPCNGFKASEQPTNKAKEQIKNHGKV